MHGRSSQWLVGTLAAAIVCSLAVATPAQVMTPPMLTADPGYPIAANPTAMPQQPASMRDAYLVSNNNYNDDDLSDRVADLEESLKKIKDAEAKAKKKAASSMSHGIRGRIYVDGALFDGDARANALYDPQNSIEMRTARLGFAGTGFDIMQYCIEFDFAGDSVSSKDIYLDIAELPLIGHIRIGHFKEPFSLEELTSSRFITFMERSVNNAVFAPARHIGVMAHNAVFNERATWAIGAFTPRAGGKDSVADDMGIDVAMRATALPWYDFATDGRGLMHIGAAFYHRECFESQETITAEIPSHNFPAIVDIADVPCDQRDVMGLEAAYVYGPFSVQSEYFLGWFNAIGQPTAQWSGFYAEASYFLTGENRRYKRSGGYFDRVKPFENFFCVLDCDGCCRTGLGAWQAKYRWSYVDMYDGGALAGVGDLPQIGTHTLGMNWYLNPYTRMMFEYIHADISPNDGGVDADANVLQVRAQIDW